MKHKPLNASVAPAIWAALEREYGERNERGHIDTGCWRVTGVFEPGLTKGARLFVCRGKSGTASFEANVWEWPDEFRQKVKAWNQ
jgi:hypothetical protein